MLGDTYKLAGLARLVRLSPDLAGPFEKAFLAAEDDLRQWMPSTANEQEKPVEFIEHCDAAFEAGTTFPYAMVTSGDEVAGYINLTPEPDHAVVGYWVRPDWRGRGLAVLALRVLTDAAFVRLPELPRIHAHLDAANRASRTVLERPAFHHQETFTRPARTSSETDTEWLYVRDRYPRGTEAERLLLRDLEDPDRDTAVVLWTDPAVARYMDDFGPRTEAEVDQWIPEARRAALSVPWFRSWVMELKATGEVVGWLGFGADTREIGDIDFAFIVDPAHRGQGYAPEALRAAFQYCFDQLGARSFWGQCHTDNQASARAMRAAGLEYLDTVDGEHRFRVDRA